MRIVNIFNRIRIAFFSKKIFYSVLMMSACLFSAQTVFAFGVRPASMDVVIVPGASSTFSVSVTNDSSADERLYLSAQPFVAQGDDGTPEFLPVETAPGVARWIEVASSTVEVPAESSVTVPLQVHVPANATPGAYQLAVFFSDQSPQALRGEHAATGARVGTLVFVTVPGALVTQLDALVFRSTEASSWVNHGPITFEAQIANQGNTFFIPRGWVTVTDLFDRQIARFPFNPEQGRILPGSTRRFLTTWGTDAKQFQGFWSAVKQEWRHLLIGPYHVRVTFDDAVIQPQMHEASVSIWPWQLLIVVFGGGLLLIAGMWILGRAYLAPKR